MPPCTCSDEWNIHHYDLVSQEFRCHNCPCRNYTASIPLTPPEGTP